VCFERRRSELGYHASGSKMPGIKALKESDQVGESVAHRDWLPFLYGSF
jgi:hypothetical protein